MLGKIAGDKTGIAKKVSPIVVKVGLINGPADWLYATSLVSRGLGPDPGLNNPSSTRCVVLLPFQFPSDDTGDFSTASSVHAMADFLLPDSVRNR
jgi:hypothetical protein